MFDMPRCSNTIVHRMCNMISSNATAISVGDAVVLALIAATAVTVAAASESCPYCSCHVLLLLVPMRLSELRLLLQLAL